MSDTEPKLSPGAEFERLVKIMARLRAPGGCPWDREQNFDTIKPYLLEETYEVMDAIDARDFEGLAEELGDLLLQPVFFAQMAAEEGRFDIADSLAAINNKLIRRHPHVFADGDAKTPDDVKRRWDEIKADEKKAKPQPKGLLAGVPRSLPALVEAQQIASRAAGAGFDWENIEQVFDQLREELAELDEARQQSQLAPIEDEIGDLFFVDRQSRAVSQGRSRAGAAQHQRQVPPPLRARRGRRRGFGQDAPGSDHGTNGVAMAGRQAPEGMIQVRASNQPR